MTVYRSEAITLAELEAKHPNLTHLIISPGPGHPTTDSGISMPAIAHFAGRVPIMGVCMGLQCMYTVYGGTVAKAGEVVHGKTSAVAHDGAGLFKGLSQNVQSTRYHSLAAKIDTLPDALLVTSRTAGGVVMGLRHKEFALEGVQYHPESILSEEGKLMFANFLSLSQGTWKANPGFETAGNPPNPIGAGATSNGLTIPAPAAVPTILNKIEHQRHIDVAKAKATPGYSPKDLDALIALHVAPPLVSFHQRLQAHQGPSTSTVSLAQPGAHMALLAEIKRASPSKGDIAGPDSPSSPAIALSYALAGASAISVLTEPKWFKGSLDDLRAVRAAVDCLPNRPAILRKDFILDVYQIDEARVYGADTVLLIVAMLDDAKLVELFNHSKARGMEPLVEVNNADELARALAVGAKVIGVNNRNLHDFEVDMGTTSRMADVIKAKYGGEGGAEVILISLSGITGRADVEKYAQQGVGAVLVGESLMRAKDKGAFVRELLGTQTGAGSAGAAPAGPKPPLVKICGLKTAEAAVVAAEAGADLLGLIFVPGSKRAVTVPQAKDIISAVRALPPKAAAAAVASSTLDTSDWFAFQAARLAASGKKPLFVGVFQDAPLADILEAVDSLDLDVVQLHGSEPASLAKFIPRPVIRAFHVPAEGTNSEVAQALRDASRPGLHAVPLLDTKVGALSGGAGRKFDWSVATRLVDGRAELGLPALPVILAGGLTTENVVEGVEVVRPFAVDVSGGVETDGAKDLAKIRQFVKLVKGA